MSASHDLQASRSLCLFRFAPSLLLPLGHHAPVLVVLRPPLWQRVMPTVALLVLAVMAFGAGIEQGGWWLPAGFAAAVLGLVGAARSVTLRVEARPDDVMLVNWLRTVHLPWSEVARCDYDGDGLWIRCNDGSELRSSPFQHGHTALAFARTPAKEAAVTLENIRKRSRRRR